MAGDEIDESQGICVDNLSFIISRHGALTKNDRSCITDNYHASIHLSYLVCLSFIIPRHGAWQRTIDLVLLTIIMSLSMYLT